MSAHSTTGVSIERLRHSKKIAMPSTREEYRPESDHDVVGVVGQLDRRPERGRVGGKAGDRGAEISVGQEAQQIGDVDRIDQRSSRRRRASR